MAEYKKILVAVDFSHVSVKAFTTAVDLATRIGARVKVVHAVPMQAIGLPKNADAVYMEDLHTQQMQGAQIQLDEFIERHAPRATQVETGILSGEPQSEVLRAAEEPGVGMIVMGTHGRSGLRELLMGSVAESVLKGTRIPVLCVKG